MLPINVSLKKHKTVFLYFSWKESLVIINYYIVKKVSNKTKLQYLTLLILWLLSQHRVMALYWKHSGIIKLPGDTEVFLVRQATMVDFPVIFFFFFQFKWPVLNLLTKMPGIQSSPTLKSTKLSKPLVL